MTKPGKVRCEWCGAVFAQPQGPGRPRRFCRPSHRQRAYEARRTAERRGIGPDEVMLTRRSWEALRDALYRLEAPAEDVATDLAAGRETKQAYIDAMAHLSVAVRELVDLAVEPVAVGGDRARSPVSSQ